MTRETKVGLLMVVMLVGVFGFMVYKKMHRPSEALAGQRPETDPASNRAPADETPESAPFGDVVGVDRTPVGRRITPVAAAAPEVLTENPAAISATRRDADPFEVVSKNEATSNAARVSKDTPIRAVPQSTSTAPTKPKLPTTVTSDDEFADAFAQPAPVATRTTAVVTSSEPTASFDPFERATPSSTTTITSERNESSAIVASEPSPVVANDPFEAPLEVARPATRAVETEAFADERAAVEVDPFESAPQFSASNAREPAAKVDDSFTQDRTPAFEAPQSQPASRSTAAFEVAEEPTPSAPVVAAPITAPLAMKAPAFEPPPSTSPFATESAPTRTAAVDEDRLGGFQPVEVGKRAMNEFTREERTATTAIPASDPFGEARRPAPTGRVDEDFAPRATSKPLVPGDTYNIEPNDNFWTISRKKYGTGRYFMALSQHNLKVIPDPKRMKPGVTIATPPAAELERTYSTLIPAAAPAEPVLVGSIQPARSTSSTTATKDEVAGFFVSADGVPMYRVGQEDTLSGIAQRHLGRSSRWVQVFEMNREILTDGNSLKLGTVLRLPGDASRVDVVGATRLSR